MYRLLEQLSDLRNEVEERSYDMFPAYREGYLDAIRYVIDLIREEYE